MPKQAACTDFYHCTFDATNERQMDQHTKEYHKPQPIFAINNNPALPPIQLHRDPNQGMYFACPHPDCYHAAMTRDNARKHYRTLISLLQLILLLLSTRDDRYYRSSSNGFSKALFSRIVESDSDAAFPSLRNTTHALGDATATQLLKAMSKLANAVAGLSKQVAKRSRKVHKMSEQMDWLMEEVDNIRGHHESLEMHTRPLQKEMRKVERHMKYLVEDSRDVRAGPLQHQKNCKFTRQDLRSPFDTGSGASITTTTAVDVALLRPCRGYEISSMGMDPSLLTPSGSDLDYAPPGLNNNNNNYHNNRSTSASALSQILHSMNHISDTLQD
ncbi:MAG: hypothetical protein JOS17DRAFT_835529 [Linnemannia elongata]|nr:MAG: hypothetical protein JOS17DRAFT_835529 [Linnemannia elongata]